MTIQLTFSEIAAPTSSTHSATKNAIAFWRRVTPPFYILNYATASSGITWCSVVTTCAIRATLTCQAKRTQRADADPVQIELIPCESVTRGHRMRVMVVVPPFAEGDERHPPVV